MISEGNSMLTDDVQKTTIKGIFMAIGEAVKESIRGIQRFIERFKKKDYTPYSPKSIAAYAMSKTPEDNTKRTYQGGDKQKTYGDSSRNNRNTKEYSPSRPTEGKGPEREGNRPSVEYIVEKYTKMARETNAKRTMSKNRLYDADNRWLIR